MELSTRNFDTVLSSFLSSWNIGRIEEMTVEEYADLSNRDSFCYWLEYGTTELGAIGAVSLHKFELWKPKEKKDFTETRFVSNGKYTWNPRKGKTLNKAFAEIKRLILEIIEQSRKQDWSAIDAIPFHAIAKWKIAFLYSNRKLLPIYSKRALLAIANGLGNKQYPYKTTIPTLQQYILSYKKRTQSIENFASQVYLEFAEKYH